MSEYHDIAEILTRKVWWYQRVRISISKKNIQHNGQRKKNQRTHI